MGQESSSLKLDLDSDSDLLISRKIKMDFH